MSEVSAAGPMDSVAKSGTWFSASKAIIGVLAILLILAAVGAYLVYSSEEQTINDGRQQAATLSTQLAKSQQETKDRQAELDTTRTQLASTQADLATSQSSGRSLSDQLAKSQQDVQAAQASAKDLQDRNAGLTSSLSQARESAQDAQASATALSQKMTKATAKAQLVDEFFAAEMDWRQSGDNAKWRTSINTWMRHLDALGDPTIDEYFADYDAALAKKDSAAWGKFVDKTLAYLIGGVVDSLQ